MFIPRKSTWFQVKLCAKHGYTPEVGYKQFKRCQHQHHQPEISKKTAATRSVPISRCISLAEKYFRLGQCYV